MGKHRMGFTLTLIVGTIGSIAAIAAGGFWLWASLVDVPNDIDNIIKILQWVSRLNSYAAMAAGTAAICGLIVLLIGRAPAYWS